MCVSVKEAWQRHFAMKVSKRLVYKLVEQGVLRSIKIGGRVLIFEDSITDYIVSQLDATPEEEVEVTVEPPRVPPTRSKGCPGFKFFKT
jgi:excisionase family DNA binding protein